MPKLAEYTDTWIANRWHIKSISSSPPNKDVSSSLQYCWRVHLLISPPLINLNDPTIVPSTCFSNCGLRAPGTIPSSSRSFLAHAWRNFLTVKLSGTVTRNYTTSIFFKKALKHAFLVQNRTYISLVLGSQDFQARRARNSLSNTHAWQRFAQRDRRHGWQRETIQQ